MPRLVVRGYGGSPKGPTPAVPSSGGTTLLTAVGGYLADVAALASLTAIYLEEADVDWAFPHLIVNTLGERITNEANTPDYMAETRLQFTVSAATDETASILGWAAYYALMPWRADRTRRPLLAWQDGYEMRSTPGAIRMPKEWGRTRGNVNAWDVQLECVFMVGRSMSGPPAGGYAYP